MDKPPVAGMPWQEYAFDRMVEANPFPSVMGRVCPAPCEDGCNRNEVDDFVGINAVEQYVGDWAIENKIALPAAPALTGKRVAVVGGGPAGLAAAHFLRRKGHAVDDLRGARQARRHDALRHSRLPHAARQARRRDRPHPRARRRRGALRRQGRARRLDRRSRARLRRDLLGDRRADGPAAAGSRRRRRELHHRRRIPRRLQPRLGVLDREAHRRGRRRRHLDRRRLGRAPPRPRQPHPAPTTSRPTRHSATPRTTSPARSAARGRQGRPHLALPASRR